MKRIILPILYAISVLAGCATTDISIESTRWYLLEIEGDSDIRIINEKEPFIEFDLESSKVGGNASCNNFFTDYTIDEEEITFGMVATTLMACPDETRQEHRFLQALSRIDSFRIEENRLYLYEGEEPIMIFESR